MSFILPKRKLALAIHPLSLLPASVDWKAMIRHWVERNSVQTDIFITQLKKSRIRPLALEDLEPVHDLLSNPKTMVYWSRPASKGLESSEWILRRYLGEGDDHECHSLALENLNTDSFLGWLNFFRFRDRIAEIGFMLSPEAQGKGVMTEAVQWALKAAFTKGGIHRLEAQLHPQNEASKKLLLRCGFQIEGVQRQNFLRNGIYEDTLLMGILKSDWSNIMEGAIN